jgi:hypothetical protein
MSCWYPSRLGYRGGRPHRRRIADVNGYNAAGTVGLAPASRYAEHTVGKVSEAEENPIPGDAGSGAIGVEKLGYGRARCGAGAGQTSERSSAAQNAECAEVELMDGWAITGERIFPANLHVARHWGTCEVGVVKGIRGGVSPRRSTPCSLAGWCQSWGYRFHGPQKPFRSCRPRWARQQCRRRRPRLG